MVTVSDDKQVGSTTVKVGTSTPLGIHGLLSFGSTFAVTPSPSQSSEELLRVNVPAEEVQP